jgi:hypothetical protein
MAHFLTAVLVVNCPFADRTLTSAEEGVAGFGANHSAVPRQQEPWNNACLIGQARLQSEGRECDPALFNLAIDDRGRGSRNRATPHQGRLSVPHRPYRPPHPPIFARLVYHLRRPRVPQSFPNLYGR